VASRLATHFALPAAGRPRPSEGEAGRPEQLPAVVTVSPTCVLPHAGLPAGIYPAGKTLEWVHGDSLAAYRQRGGHAVYGEHDIHYQFNSLGYRCPEFASDAKVRIVAVGCSYVFGIGLAREHLFHEQFAARLRADLGMSVVLWNLATSGASNDYIARLVHQALPVLDPHILITHFTHLCRREYVSVENELIKYLPSYAPTSGVPKELFRHFEALASPHDDELNYFRNYKSVESAARGRCWLYSAPQWHPSPAYADAGACVGRLIPIDKARDGEHPGPLSHRVLGGLYWDTFTARGGLHTQGR
jgi:hypothetical protein